MTTIRRFCPCHYCVGNFRTQITDVKRSKTEYEDGTKEFAVSSVDLLLPNTDVFIQNKSMGYAGYPIVGGNLNKHGLWEDFIGELEATCINKHERAVTKRGRKGLMETVYTVPVVGFKQFLPPSVDDDYMPGAYHGCCSENPADGFSGLQKAMVKKIKRNPAMFAYWMGRYYDTGLIYQYQPERSVHLKVVGNRYPPLPRLERGATEFTKGVSCRTFRRAALPGRVRVCHHEADAYQQGGNYCQADPLDYLEINLGYPRHVTHIGTAGGYPTLVPFPSRKAVGRSRMRAYNAVERYDDAPLLSAKGNGIQRGKFSAYVRILKEGESELSWVTSYEVHYRHPATHKWTLLLVAAGNMDALTEAVLDLSPHFNSREGLLTQALRIRPLTHHGRPLIRVSVYGHDPLLPHPGIGRSLRDSVASGESEEDEGDSDAPTAAQEVPTIEYAVVASRSTAQCRYVRDGTQRRSKYDDYYYGCGDLKFNKRHGWQAAIREGIDSYYYEDDLEY